MGTKGRKVEKRKQAREDAYKETINHVGAAKSNAYRKPGSNKK